MIKRHSHSGFSGDGEKIKAENIEGEVGSKAMTGFETRASSAGTGTQVVTGVGFKPKVVIIKAILENTDNGASSYGVGKASDNMNVIYSFISAALNPRHARSSSLIIFIGDTDLANKSRASLVSLDSNGFTLNWTTMDVNAAFIWTAIG